MTPREVFANAAWAEKIRGEDEATRLAIAATSALAAAGAKTGGKDLNNLLKDLTDFEVAEE